MRFFLPLSFRQKKAALSLSEEPSDLDSRVAAGMTLNFGVFPIRAQYIAPLRRRPLIGGQVGAEEMSQYSLS